VDHFSQRDLTPGHSDAGEVVVLTLQLRQHGIRILYSSDRDFRRFDFLEVRDPLAA
jgi:hypothetical protein